MEAFAKSLDVDLTAKLREIEPHKVNSVIYNEKAIKLHIHALQDLKAFFVKQRRSSKQDEIKFFKQIKPLFASRLIYCNEIYKIESNLPCGSFKIVRKYYNVELEKLTNYFTNNASFYQYYKTASEHLDKQYFIRGKHNIKLSLDSFYLQADSRFSTSHDYKVAKIIANENIKGYLQDKIDQLHTKEISTTNIPGPQLSWTASKVALTELIYALHSQGVFNEGKADLKEIANVVEAAFNIQLGHYNRTFLEIRERKTERTKFLNELKENLAQRMDKADERA